MSESTESTESVVGTAIGGVTGAVVAGVPGAVVGGALGGLLGDAYSRKPRAGNFATTLRNDLAPENVTLDAHQIYVRITTGHGTATLATANAAAARVSDNFAERAAQIEQARAAAAGAWQGAASAAASSATAPLADSFAVAQRQLAANAMALDAEVVAFDHIRSQVEPVPATPPQSSLVNAVNPFQSDVDAAINDYNAKAAKNVQLYEAYAAETAAARGQVPSSYAQPAPLAGTAGAAATGSVAPVGSASPSTPQVGSAPADRPAATDASAAPGGADVPGGGGVPGGTAGQSGAASDSPGRQTPPVTTPSATTPSGVPLLPAARDTFRGGPLAGQVRRTGTSDTRRGYTGAGPGSGGSGGFGGGPSGPGMRGGPSVGTGPAPGQSAPGGPGGRGVAAGPATRGAAGMPMSPANRPREEEDREHRRKYVLEPDDKDLFGPDQRFAPPVIGDDR
jgi:hypothetical protein